MLPLELSKQEYGGKTRADTHIWPKGTYMQIHAAPSLSLNETVPRPQILRQKKQQGHDATKWQGICEHLDITSLLHSAWSSMSTSLSSYPYSTVEFGCHDPELYLFSLALCRYQAPQTLCKILLNPSHNNNNNNKSSIQQVPFLKRISLEEMYRRAKKKMENNEVTLDDSDEDDDDGTNGDNGNDSPKELRRIQFSIRDPISMTALKTPVRGRDCLHFSVS